jgi:hypothetical protein
MQFPQYHDGSLLNLIASFLASRGGRPAHPSLAALPPASIEGVRNIVFMLVDGLGYNYLARVGRGGALREYLAGRITSVYPSTTASAITTSFTGRSPTEHGLIGWHGWFPEAGVVAAPLPFRRRGDEVPLVSLDIRPSALLPNESVFDAMPCKSFVVSQRRIVDSEYSVHMGGRARRLGYDNLSGMVDAIDAVVRSGSERKYLYAYYPEFDTVSHVHGVGSSQAAKRFAAIDEAFSQLLKRLVGTDTVLVMSADHGFIDTPRSQALELGDHPELVRLLRLPLTGEPRVAFCHVVPGAADDFMGRARSVLGGLADVRPSRELVDAGWFGPGAAHPRLAERVGDVALVMREHATIKDRVPGENAHVMVGNHGGATEDEMFVPLVVARL